MTHEQFLQKVDRLVTKEYMRAIAEQHKDGLVGIIKDTMRGNLRNGTLRVNGQPDRYECCVNRSGIPCDALEPMGLDLEPWLVDSFLERFEKCSKCSVHDLVMCSAVPYLIGKDPLLSVLYEEAGTLQVKGDFLARLDNVAEAADISCIVYENMEDFFLRENVLEMVSENPRYRKVIGEYKERRRIC